jgi:hypothetical protein
LQKSTFMVRPVGPDVLKSSHMVAASLDKQLAWAVGFFLGNTELSLELWNATAPEKPIDTLGIRLKNRWGQPLGGP